MKIVKLLGATAVAAACAGSYAWAQTKTLTVVSWGGAYTKSQVEAYHKPFIAKTGVQIKSEDYDGSVAPIKAQVQSGKVTWDIVDVELADAVRMCDEGLLEKLDPKTMLAPGADGKPATEDFIKGTLHECAVFDHSLVDRLCLRRQEVRRRQADHDRRFLRHGEVPRQARHAQEPEDQHRVRAHG